LVKVVIFKRHIKFKLLKSLNYRVTKKRRGGLQAS
jgi:hypothetical protein